MTSEDLHAADCPIRMRCKCALIAKVRDDEQAQPKTLNITGPVTINCARGDNTPEFNSYDVGA